MMKYFFTIPENSHRLLQISLLDHQKMLFFCMKQTLPRYNHCTQSQDFARKSNLMRIPFIIWKRFQIDFQRVKGTYPFFLWPGEIEVEEIKDISKN